MRGPHTSPARSFQQAVPTSALGGISEVLRAPALRSGLRSLAWAHVGMRVDTLAEMALVGALSNVQDEFPMAG